ncbi:MAG TPA: C4-type zinc ribbon domain-containing protein [Nitrospiraceae bacterium]|nr:C4-type zinc ribbon domain-containing protein [Nitrospiraceae bacterium]
MHPKLPTLIELQALDLRILEVKEQERKLPSLLQAAESPLQEITLLLQGLTSEFDKSVKERRDRESDLEVHESQVAKLRARLTELKTNKEYQTHLFEIEMANKKKGAIEEQILLLMERVEKFQEEMKQGQAKAEESNRLFTEEKKRLDAMTAQYKKEMAELEDRRRTVTGALDTALLARYDRIRATRKDVAIAPIRNGICSGCRLQLPPQLVAEVKRSDELQTCSYCHRILYWEGEPAAVSASS